ncbi:MAG: LacI family DNA-binding transcriptional regulator [Phocaeicola sp.]
MKQKVTIADIATRIGISTATVSRALTNSPSISEHVKKRVWEEAKKMGYGRTPILESAKSIVVIVPELFNHFYSEIIRFIEKTISVNGYHLATYCSYNSYEKEKSIVQSLPLNDISCLLISKAMDSVDSLHLVELHKKGVPLIQFNRIDFELEGAKFIIDNYMDTYAATQKLLNAGYIRIGFAAKHYNCPIYQEREKGYRDALADRERAFDPQLLLYSELTNDDISQVIEHFLELTPRADALLLPNYYAALQAMHLAKIRNIKVPEELGIFSMDEEIYSKYNVPSISSIERSLQNIGEDMGALVNQIITKQPYKRDKVTVYSSTLILRGSTLLGS